MTPPTHERFAVPLKMVAFDLDDTLAPSKSALPELMDTRLRELLDHVQVCIISGGQMGQFRSQVLDNLHADDAELSRLHLMPTCGTRYYRYEGGAWVERYAHDLDPEVAARAIASLEGTRRGRDLGALAPVDPPCRFGFSSTPRRPSVASVVTTIDRPA